MPKLIGSQEVKSTGQIFSPQPAILHGIIPSPSDLVYNPAFYFTMVYNSLNLKLWLSPGLKRAGGSYWFPPRKYGCNRLTWKQYAHP